MASRMSVNGRRSSMGFVLSPNKRRNTLTNTPTSDNTPRSKRPSTNIADLSFTGENVFLDVPENNDEKEKKERQLNRLQQESRKFSSPSTTPGNQNDRRKSLSHTAALTNQQLSEHYTKCIQLSTENKISVKNAFNLQLIDYMSEMLRRKDSDLNNFQVASCTLDASTKIYAYRVDSIHTDTLKMAGGLGRAQDKERNKSDGDSPDVETGVGEKKKRKVKKKVIETNLRNLNVAKFDLEFEVDPLFKKTACQFDEGRSGSGIFLNSLQLRDDSCMMMMDAETELMDTGLQKEAPLKTDIVYIPRIPDLTQKVICPTFAPFEFTTWKLGDEDSFSESPTRHNKDSPTDDAHKFDVNAVPEPFDDDDGDMDADYGLGVGATEDDCDNGTVLTVGQDAYHRAPPPQMEAVHLKEFLAKNPSEYSYFDPRLLSAWAGPSHWRLKPLSKVRGDTTEKGEQGKKKRKEFVVLKYDAEEDPVIANLFAVTRKATKLSHQTFKTWSREKTTLPLDLHYEGRNFFKLFGRSAIVIQRQKKAAEVDESVNEYNYDNQNDQTNYCAADSQDDASGYGDGSMQGYDMTDIFSQTVMGTQASSREDMEKGMDYMENLVAAPNKVAKINIGYARTAKKMDMKKLKLAMWDMLADPANNKENEKQQENQAENRAESPEKMDPSSSLEFSSLYKNLPPRLSSKMSENLSVPLAFIALLHLANEHNLKLEDPGDLTNFTIMQG